MRRSLADIRQTLALEPRHFGALAGFGMILQAMDRKNEAIGVFKRALEINPQLDKVREALEELEKETGRRRYLSGVSGNEPKVSLIERFE